MTIINRDEVIFMRPFTLRKLWFVLRHPSVIRMAFRGRKSRYFQILTVKNVK